MHASSVAEGAPLGRVTCPIFAAQQEIIGAALPADYYFIDMSSKGMPSVWRATMGILPMVQLSGRGRACWVDAVDACCAC